MGENKLIRLTPNNEVVKFLARTNEMVQQFPEWKRGILEVSSLRTNSEARVAPQQGHDASTSPSE